MNKKFLLTILMMAVTGAASSASAMENLNGHIDVLVGIKNMEDEWNPNENQFGYGVQSDFRGVSWPVSLALDVIGSGSEEEENGVDVRASTLEADLGIRKVWSGSFAPFLGGGLAFVAAEQETERDALGGRLTIDDDDAGMGVWIGGGFLYHVTPMLNFGATLRYSTAEVELFDDDKDAGGVLVALMGGVQF